MNAVPHIDKRDLFKKTVTKSVELGIQSGIASGIGGGVTGYIINTYDYNAIVLPFVGLLFGSVWGVLMGLLMGLFLGVVTRRFFAPPVNRSRYRWVVTGICLAVPTVVGLAAFFGLTPDPTRPGWAWYLFGALNVVSALWVSRGIVGWYDAYLRRLSESAVRRRNDPNEADADQHRPRVHKPALFGKIVHLCVVQGMISGGTAGPVFGVIAISTAPDHYDLFSTISMGLIVGLFTGAFTGAVAGLVSGLIVAIETCAFHLPLQDILGYRRITRIQCLTVFVIAGLLLDRTFVETPTRAIDMFMNAILVALACGCAGWVSRRVADWYEAYLSEAPDAAPVGAKE
jgi:hypothetical protein